MKLLGCGQALRIHGLNVEAQFLVLTLSPEPHNVGT